MRERERVCVCERERVCVCVREREREGVCVVSLHIVRKTKLNRELKTRAKELMRGCAPSYSKRSFQHKYMCAHSYKLRDFFSSSPFVEHIYYHYVAFIQ